MATNRTQIAAINRVNELAKDIRELEKTIREIRVSGYASASLSSGGGSKSYTRADLNTLVAELSRLKSELAAASRIAGFNAPLIRRIQA